MTRTFKLSARPSAGVDDLLSTLNPQQQAVVTAGGGPMLVVAGAGSGKTRTLTHRLARLLRDGVEPGRLMLVTFTNRAAREMLGRVEQLAAQDARRVWGGTFHHVANRLLREHAAVLGLSPDFTILDREDAGDLLSACVNDVGIRVGRSRFPRPAVLGSIASAAANTLHPVAAVVDDRFVTFRGQLAGIEQVLVRYADRKRQQQLLDYDDLLVFWHRLLVEHDSVRETLATRFLHVLVDEYQDTNAIQGAIVDALASRHRNLCVVGDDAQSIYGFRGASFENIAGFSRRYPDARIHRLEINYRSTPEIVSLANRSIACNDRQLPKTLRATRPAGLKPARVPCADHLVQSRFIGEYILHLLDEGRDLMDIAVLYRSHWHAMEIQLELERRNIPFTVRGGLRFFEQAHIKDVLGFLRIRHNGHDELAWQRVLRLVPRIGGAVALRIWETIASADEPLRAVGTPTVDAALPPAARAPFARFRAVLDGMLKIAAPGDVIDHVMRTFYEDHMRTRFPNATLRGQDIRGVADFAGQYRTVEAFLSDVALAGDFTGETCEDGPDEQHFVTLSTVHQAKGLEWPIVLVPWASDGRFPTDLAMGTAEELEEERRVFHVAVTRARDELYLLVPQVWSNHRGRRILMKPSRFITELDGADVLETMRLEEDLPEVTAGPASGRASAHRAGDDSARVRHAPG